MAEALAFKDEAAAEYDRAFAHVTAYFMPFLLRAADVTPGMRVLDIATGTGPSAAAALAAVGPTGHIAAADVSPAMAERARERLGNAPNCLGLCRGRAGTFVRGFQFRRRAVQSRAYVFPRPGAGPFGVSPRAAPRRPRRRLGEYRCRALLQPFRSTKLSPDIRQVWPRPSCARSRKAKRRACGLCSIRPA